MTDGEIAKKVFGIDSENTIKLLSDLRQYGMVRPFRSYSQLGSSGWSEIRDVRNNDTNWIISDVYLKYLFDEDDIAFMRMMD